MRNKKLIAFTGGPAAFDPVDVLADHLGFDAAELGFAAGLEDVGDARPLGGLDFIVDRPIGHALRVEDRADFAQLGIAFGNELPVDHAAHALRTQEYGTRLGAVVGQWLQFFRAAQGQRGQDIGNLFLVARAGSGYLRRYGFRTGSKSRAGVE